MKKLGFISIALLVALGSLGVSYARWTDTVNISNAAVLGKLSAKFAQAVSNDPAVSIDPSKQLDPVDVGTWSLPISNIPDWTGGRGSNNLATTTVTGEGTYTLTVSSFSPYQNYNGSVGCTIENTGDVPLKIKTVTVTKVGPPVDSSATYMNPIPGGALVEASHTVIDPGKVALGTIRPEFVAGAAPGIYTTTVTFTITGWNLP
jgi:hypothetical protein